MQLRLLPLQVGGQAAGQSLAEEGWASGRVNGQLGSGTKSSTRDMVPHFALLDASLCRMYNRVYRPGGLVRWILLTVAIIMFLVCGAATVAAVRGIILNWSKYQVSSALL